MPFIVKLQKKKKKKERKKEKRLTCFLGNQSPIANSMAGNISKDFGIFFCSPKASFNIGLITTRRFSHLATMVMRERERGIEVKSYYVMVMQLEARLSEHFFKKRK